MENSTWQSKCGPSMWQSSLPSSSQLHSQRPDNEELTSSNHRMVQEAILLRNSNLDFGKSGCSELGSSFLSLLSRPPSLLQCDLQLSPSFKSIIASSNTPINSSKASDFASGIEVSLPSSGLLTPNPDRQNAEAGADFSSNFSSIPVSAKCLTGSGLNNVFPVPGLNFQKSELVLPIINQKGPSTERSKELFLLREGSISNNFTGNIGNVHNGTNVSSVSRQSSALSSGCLRVFCLGISGYLLLSSAGLLGVVCSCHGMHMSVSNFSEHSGLCNANPGVAVFMGSGETIAQWRKDHFGKLGISIPGDYSGWDWSDGISVTAGKLGPTLPDISICSDVSPQVSSFGASQFSGQYRNNVAFPEHPKVGCHVVDKFLHEEKQLQGHNFLFKGLNSTTLSNYDSVTDKKVMSRVMTGGSTMSSSVSVRGTDNVSQSTSGYKDKNSKFWNSSVSFPQNQKCPGKSFNARKVEGPIVYRDSVSSNFELRLGQPSVQSRALESSSLLASGSNQIGAPWEAKSSVLADQLPKLDSCRDGISQSILKREQSRFYQNHLPGCYSSTYASQVDRYEGDIAGVSANPLLLPHGKYHEENVHLKGTNDVMNGNHAMAGKHLCESYIAKGDSFGFPWVSGCRMDRESNSNALYGENKNGEGVGCALDSSCIAAEQNISYSTKFKESSFPNQFMWGSGHNRSYLEDSGLNTRQFSSMKVNASDIECLGKISCPEHHGWSGHEFPKTISSSIDSGITLASQALVVASSRTNSNSIHSPTPACSNKGSICVRQCSVPDSLQMFASQQQHTPEFPNRNHSSASIETIRDQYMFRKSYDKTQVSIASSTSKGQYCGYHFASTPCASGVASEFHTSRLAYWMGADKEKLTPVAGSTKHRHFSGLSQGKSLPTGGTKMQCQLSHVMYPTERPLLRFSGSKDQITLPSLPGKSFQAEPYTNFPTKCSCATKTAGVDKNYFKHGASATASKELGGNAAGGAATLYVSNVNEMYNYPNESSFQNRDLLGQRMKKVECTSFQWRDVPRKMEEMCGRMTKEQQTGSVSKNGDDEGHTPNAVAAYANCFKTSTQDAELLKEQEMSNISSGCSAPVVTQISIGNDNKDSPTVDAVDRSCRNNLVVDEGSGIERCCSSDDALDSELSAGFCGFPSVINSMDVRSTERTPSETSRSLIDELRLRDLLRLKKMQNQCPSFTIQEKSNHTQIFEICSRKRKKRRMMKWKRLNASFPPSSQSIAQKGSLKCIGSNELHSYAFKDMGMLLRNDQESSNNCACSSEPSSKRRKSALSPSVISLETNFHRINHHGGVYVDNQTKKTINHDNFEAPEVIRRKRLRLASANPTFNEVHINESSSVGAEVTGTSSGNEVNIHKSIARPIVCGKYGIISNGSPSKRAKIVCMKKILIATKKSCLSENAKTNLSSVKKFKKSSSTKSRGFFIEPSSLEKGVHSRGRDGVANRAESSHVLLSELNPQCSLGEREIACSNSSKECESLSRVIKKRSHDKFDEQHSAWNSCPTQLKPKSKEIRERSLYELTATGKDSSSLNFSTVKKSTPVWQRKRRYNGKLVKNAADVIHNAKKCMKDHYKSALDSGSLCCVCGSSNKEESNYLLKCNSCSIKVHQACYGILKVPKAHWYCRPCKTSSKDIACVLCGYGGGAMTCALQSHNIVKSLLQAWDIDYETKDTDPVSSKPSRNQLNLLASSNSRAEDDTFSVIKVADSQSSLLLLGNMDLHLEDCDSLSFAHDSVVRNSITAGALDPTVKQWVHVVCGLWTPGTRCPNVDTMSAFDVSGAIWTKSDVVCSICTRPGGACIECRVADCSVHFHPWCAQQKGLLQSEVEGGHKENVGFYGRCVDHATLSQSNAGDYPTEGEKEFTCARTEGYKGRKWDDSKSILPHCPDRSNGCHVPQEQLNAWLHINGQRSFPVVLSKFWKSEIEFDYRKEYARYKQSKGWKHLVVYKSGIHGLGLYTSQFISRGAMVVEYVGEIVGLRVTDKRESEYQTGKKLQYKSACYFFRIDKEHIIDATRKGGIARFVNHSCLPNCVAKVISVRNEKKVVFFAERDIYPGEEITYDYHFNHEDEGKKIPCFCNSKNCRRYLN